MYIAVLVKGRAIHLSYVDRRRDVFCLFYKWNCMRPIVARLNPVVDEVLLYCYNVVSTFCKRRLIKKLKKIVTNLRCIHGFSWYKRSNDSQS